MISVKSRSRAPNSKQSAVVLSEGEKQPELGILQRVIEWSIDDGTNARVPVILRAETLQARAASTSCSVRKRLHLSFPPNVLLAAFIYPGLEGAVHEGDRETNERGREGGRVGREGGSEGESEQMNAE